MQSTLYYGDNLQILRNHIPDNSIDLIYLDPPFNSKSDYNILYKEPTGELSKAQITAFEDTWHWTEEAETTFHEIIEIAPIDIVEMITAFRKFIKQNDMMAYLTMMCIRLLERELPCPYGQGFLIQRYMTRSPDIICSAARGIFTGVTSRSSCGRF